MVWPVFATYIHRLDPILFQFTESIVLRWYGLAYLAGFLIGYLLLKWLADRDLWVLPGEKTADFIAAAALLGVFFGGRLGYILFYHIPAHGWGSLAEDPLLIFKVWEGGMASHGGILGLAIFTFFYARKYKVSWAGLADGLCVVGPIGLLCGRIANFINGELYGRITSGVPWAVKFPTALVDRNAPESANLRAAMEAAAAIAPETMAGLPGPSEMMTYEQQGYFYQRLLDANREIDGVAAAIAPYLEARHPSQIYEGLLEGGVVFGILWIVRLKYPRAPYGMITGLFFFLYASFRIFAEQFREPDAAWVIEGWMTQGQFLSLFLYLFAAGFFLYAWKRGANKGNLAS